MADVVILAGGRGARLEPYTTVFPKPLLPVGRAPVLEILLRQLARAGFVRVTLAVGYLAELIEAYFGDGSQLGLELIYVRERDPLGTVGPLAEIALTEDHVLVLNGDLLTTLDFRALIDVHVRGDALATIAVTQRGVPVQFGVVHTESDRIVRYEEKPMLGYDVSMGVYVIDREVVELIPAGERLDFPELVTSMLDRGLLVAAYRSTDFWLDIGNRDDYHEAAQEADRLLTMLLGEAADERG